MNSVISILETHFFQVCVSYFLNLLLFTLFLCFSIQGRSATQHDFQTWINVNAMGNFHRADKTPSKLKYWLEVQERLGDDSTHFTQTILRPGLGYALMPNVSLWLGYGWIDTGYPVTSSPFKENRIWEQLLWTTKNNYWTLTSRSRLEQRYRSNDPKPAYRIRQLVKLSIPLKKHPKFSLVGSDELFFHKNHSVDNNSFGIDQNRFFLGLGYHFNHGFTTEIGYMNQYIRRFRVPNFQANIASINFNFSF